MALTVISFDTTDLPTYTTGVSNHSQLSYLLNWLKGLKGGVKRGNLYSIWASAVAASGTYTISSGSGTVTATIGGTAVAITWATDDTTSAALLAAAINANTTVNKWVSATSALGVVTVTAIQGGFLGNNVTTTASGTGHTAQQAKLTGGTSAAVNTVSFN